MKKNKDNLIFYWRDNKLSVSCGECYILAHQLYPDFPGATLNLKMFALRSDISVFFTVEDQMHLDEIGKIFLNENKFQKYVKAMYGCKNRYDATLKEIYNTNLKKASNVKIAKLYQKIFHYGIATMIYYAGSQQEPLAATETALKIIIRKHFSAREVHKLTNSLVRPPVLDNIEQEEIDFINLVLEKNSLTRKDFLKHSLKYSWLFFNSYRVDECFEFLKERFKDYKKDKALKEKIFLIKDEKEKLKIRQDKILAKLGKKAEYYAHVFQTMSLSRMNLKYTWAGFIFLFRDLQKEIASRLKLPVEDVVFYLKVGEVADWLTKGIKIDIEEIKRRKDFFSFELMDGKIVFNSGMVYYNQIAYQYPELFAPINAKELKGVIACHGYAKGIARVIKVGDINTLQNDNERFKAGNILIAAMTQPNAVVLMKKAAAIVTDEGGLTSHAAIVARELKIPCIVGTKTATQVIKDGDLVEVDANKGIIKILNKK